ncbi:MULTISPECIES: cytochrome P450 [unclassified Streptomyces]|uniref:cytochrome P450 family protein n=1 Tax=unclassified Streptomyces TaxID=2593676 RepID=UPI002DD7C5D0|nr:MULTISPECIES: cytochrome P450 [unclassified Streptomyces]WSA95938.1 cytochrome P450 [Streptomyces sp. NBC_01795]WSB80353.1 cytochrome P450 [Streptomyces sp. NBC_01775]WSS40150.1 cytochrome P450 [Streptomyces sp. NBC_01187]
MTALPQPFDEAFRAMPHAVYAKLREEAPVHRVALPDGSPAWLVTRDEDVRAGLADTRLSVDKAHAREGYQGFSLPPALDANLLNMDQADHLRLRRLVSQGFTPRRTESLRGGVQAVVDRLADDLAARFEAGQEADFVHDFATPLPLTVISDLFDVPEADRRPFASWVTTMLALEDPRAVAGAITSMHGFLRSLVDRRRAAPGDDLLSGLIQARDEGDRLSEDELCSLAFLVLGAGIENVQHTLSAGILALLRDPGQLAALREEPALRTGAVEELLRLAHPNLTAIRRFPREEVEYGGFTIPAGDTVLLCLASANRDPARYDRPDELDIRRTDNAHLALGQGVHYCLGAPLARMETDLALETLLGRFPGLRPAVAPERLVWRTSFRSHALTRLPLTLRTD